MSLLENQYGRCAYCNTDLRFVNIHRDHVIPYSYTQKTMAAELCLSCARCNLKKSSRMFDMNGLTGFIVEMMESHGDTGEGWPEGAQEYWNVSA